MAQSTTRLRKSNWNTYAVRCYSHQVGTDPRATGGVHLYQVRKGKAGWMGRIVDSTGRFRSAGPAAPISSEWGEAHFETARSR